MKANNLSISVPYKGCLKNCTYCVSKMTGYMIPNFDLMLSKIEKVKHISKIAGVTSILFTSKGEVFENFEQFEILLKAFKEFPCEVQTNGVELSKNPSLLYKLINSNIDTIAFSIDNFNQLERLNASLILLKEHSKILRATINMWDQTYKIPPKVWIEILHLKGFRQVSFRTLSIPEKCVNTEESKKAQNWIKENAKPNLEWNSELEKLINESRKIRSLNFGGQVYSYKDIAISIMPFCVQENNNGENIRSLIFQEDGHIYDSWDDPASIIF